MRRRVGHLQASQRVRQIEQHVCIDAVLQVPGLEEGQRTSAEYVVRLRRFVVVGFRWRLHDCSSSSRCSRNDSLMKVAVVVGFGSRCADGHRQRDGFWLGGQLSVRFCNFVKCFLIISRHKHSVFLRVATAG